MSDFWDDVKKATKIGQRVLFEGEAREVLDEALDERDAKAALSGARTAPPRGLKACRACAGSGVCTNGLTGKREPCACVEHAGAK